VQPQQLIAIADSAFAESKRLAGDWIRCGPGCSSCCYKPFAISADDAARLRSAATPEIRARASAQWRRMWLNFPGDAETGSLTGAEDWREWFFRLHEGTACPVLDEATGACLLHDHRPVACRLAGALVTIGGQTPDPCPLCFDRASAEDRQRAHVIVPLPPAPQQPPDTIIAYALSRFSDGGHQAGCPDPA
jgi:Fe-S-cluster containining protein